MTANIAIIGAGLSGISAGCLLSDQAEVTIFEKARGVSGRMSTRRAESYYFDHGAQYFTVRTQAFMNFIQPLLAKGIIAPWHPHYVKFKGNQMIDCRENLDNEKRYVGVPGMNDVVKYLSQDLHVHLNTKITSLAHQGKWQLTDDHGQQYGDFDWVVVTAPAPQTISLLPESFKYYQNIHAVDMDSCVALMLGFEQPVSLDFDVAHVEHPDVSWIAVNSHKPGRNHRFTLMIHSTADYAQSQMDNDPACLMKDLITKVHDITGCDVSHADYKTLHQWRYASNAENPMGHVPVLIDDASQLAVCGDWVLGGRVEGAFLSAHHLINEMQVYIS